MQHESKWKKQKKSRMKIWHITKNKHNKHTQIYCKGISKELQAKKEQQLVKLSSRNVSLTQFCILTDARQFAF